jgi:ABC-2 type transport system permease protein
MIPAIKSEFRKLLTVRSTYVILALCLALTILFAFYLEGYALKTDVQDPGKLASEVTSAAAALGFFISLAGVLLMTHEYRYNTIMYTLTAAQDRSKVLLAKIIVVSAFAIVVTLLACALAPALTALGVHLKGLDMAPQTLHVADLAWRTAFYGWCYAMIALILAAIVRNQIGTIVALLVFPALGESLLTLLLKSNAKYLPFHALGTLLEPVGVRAGSSAAGILSTADSVKVLLSYLIVGGVVALVLFKRRDAN